MPGITDPTEAYFKDGQWGWDLTQWRKLPLVFGYTGKLVATVLNSNLAAGNPALNTGTVGAGYIWIITNIHFRYTGTAPDRMRIRLVSNATNYELIRENTVVSDDGYDRQGWWVLDEDDKIQLLIIGATATDTAELTVTGFTMAIAE